MNWVDVCVANAQVFVVPMELSLKLMAVISSDFTDAEWELFNDMIDEVDCVTMCVAFIYLQCAGTSSIINGGILKASYLFSCFAFESQKLNNYLYVVPGNLLVVTFGMDFARSCPVWKSIQSITFLDAVNASIGYLDLVITRHVPRNADGADLVFLTQVNHLFFDLRSRSVCMPFGDRRFIDQAIFAILLIGCPPAIKAGAANIKMATGFDN